MEAAKDRTESNLKEGGLTAKCKDVGNPSRLDLILTPLLIFLKTSSFPNRTKRRRGSGEP